MLKAISQNEFTSKADNKLSEEHIIQHQKASLAAQKNMKTFTD